MDDPNAAFKVCAVIGVFFGLIAFYVVAAYFEAQAYNRLTGAHATTWDAMCVELRVQAEPKK